MSTIKFVHTDCLRLATAVSGIADAPAWLQQLAGNCVRQAARNVIDTAIAREVDFVLIAGGITESPDDLPAAIEWLSPQLAPLKQHGIQVVAFARDQREVSLLSAVCDQVLTAGDQVLVSRESGRPCSLRKSQNSSTLDEDLVVCIGNHHGSLSGRTIYNAIPAIESSEDADISIRSGHLSLSAGATQAVGPHETLEFGCLLVQANTQHREIRSEFVATDVIRFATEDLHLSASTTIESLSAAILQASDSIGRTMTQTVIVDWCVNAELVSELSEVSRFGEQQMLHRLRSDVQSGHRGVWPRRIEFTSTSNLKVTSPALDSVEEYIEVVSGAVHSFDLDRFSYQQRMLHGESGVDPTLISGLGLLGRVA